MKTDTFARPDDLTNLDDPNVLYARSYLLTRLVVGAVGVLLPTTLFLLDGFFLSGQLKFRGSLSAYYHSPARDVFVASLCVTGFFLITYMAGQKNVDYWLSTVAGVAVLGVAFLPTQRSGLTDGAALCGSDPMPSNCTQLQQAFGETQVATVHFASAAVFIGCLAAICYFFGRREKQFSGNIARANLHYLCGAAIVASILWIALGALIGPSRLTILGFTPLYVGEVVSVYAFGLAWLVKGWDLLKAVFRG